MSAIGKPGSGLSGRTCASTPQCTKSWGGGTRADSSQESHTGGDVIRKLKACKGPGSGSSVQRSLMPVVRTEKESGTGWSPRDASAWLTADYLSLYQSVPLCHLPQPAHLSPSGPEQVSVCFYLCALKQLSPRLVSDDCTPALLSRPPGLLTL